MYYNESDLYVYDFKQNKIIIGELWEVNEN
jgi:hypothetical protein